MQTAFVEMHCQIWIGSDFPIEYLVVQRREQDHAKSQETTTRAISVISVADRLQ